MQKAGPMSHGLSPNLHQQMRSAHVFQMVLETAAHVLYVTLVLCVVILQTPTMLYFDTFVPTDEQPLAEHGRHPLIIGGAHGDEQRGTPTLCVGGLVASCRRQV